MGKIKCQLDSLTRTISPLFLTLKAKESRSSRLMSDVKGCKLQVDNGDLLKLADNLTSTRIMRVKSNLSMMLRPNLNNFRTL